MTRVTTITMKNVDACVIYTIPTVIKTGTSTKKNVVVYVPSTKNVPKTMYGINNTVTVFAMKKNVNL